MTRSGQVSSKIIIRNETAFHIMPRLLRRCIEEAGRQMRLGTLDLVILFVTDRRMRRYHEQFFRDSGSTDVISFPRHERLEKGSCVGDLLVCPEFAWAQHSKFQHSPGEELLTYVLHGMLHLLGYDDLKPRAKKVMFQEQDKLLGFLKMNYPNVNRLLERARKQ